MITIACPDVPRAAQDYAARGWSVVPIESLGKRPLVPWMPFQRRIAGADEIAHWFRHWPQANFGIVTGAVSDLVVLDVDPLHGGAGSLDGLAARHGPLPRTVEAVTGGGGRHVYFSHPGGTVHNRVGLLPGLDIRGDGGCVVAPPSTHASRRPYVWRAGHSPDLLPLAPMPAWPLELIRDGVVAAGMAPVRSVPAAANGGADARPGASGA